MRATARMPMAAATALFLCSAAGYAATPFRHICRRHAAAFIDTPFSPFEAYARR